MKDGDVGSPFIVTVTGNLKKNELDVRFHSFSFVFSPLHLVAI